MSRQRPIAVLALASLAACAPTAPRPLPRPLPTEHVLDEQAEERAHEERRRWIEELHRTADDLDWRAVERANGLREQARRNALAARGGDAKSAISLWTEVGSSNQAGRMQVALLSPDRQTLYAGSALGGLWRAAPDGSGWTPLGDNLFGGVYDLAVLPGELPGDPEVLAARTGANQLRVTRDGGATWELPTGLGNLDEIRGLALLETPVPTLLVCGLRQNAGLKLGLWASSDYGRTFQPRWQSSVVGRGWMWVPRTGVAAQDTVFLARRGELLRSSDGGQSFTSQGTATGNVTDVRLTGSEAGAPTLYAMLQVSNQWSLWRSDDAGAQWAAVHTPSEFWGPLCASITDPQRVLYGGVEAHRSVDGGQSFVKVNGWGQYYGNPAIYLHADMMGFTCQRDLVDPSKETWWVACDGGLYESADRMQTVANRSLSGLGVSQYYSTLTSSSDSERILAGSQDQGYQFGTLAASTGDGPSTPFAQLISGDYGHLTSGDGTHGRVYSTYPGFVLVSQGQLTNQLFFADFPATAHSWLPPVVADPLDVDAFFFCGAELWRYTRSGNAWTPSVHSGFDFTVNGAAYLSALAFAPTDPQRAYAVTNNGRLYRSLDHGLTWQASASTAPGQHYFYGSAIAVDPADPQHAVVGGSGYSSAGVVRTTDGGVTWQADVLGLPATLVYDLAFAPDGSGDVYAACEAGAWRRDAQGGQWGNAMGDEAPLTVYWSVEAVEPNLMRFATYGRGIWDHEVYPTPGWFAYGQGKLNSLGNWPVMTATGTPTASVDDLVLHLDGAVPGKPGVTMYSAGAGSAPFAGGTLLLAPPITRGPVVVTDALGHASVAIDVEAALVGEDRCYQLWYRDPDHPDASGVGLSDAVRVTFGP